jgi:hypothetical protein
MTMTTHSTKKSEKGLRPLQLPNVRFLGFLTLFIHE